MKIKKRSRLQRKANIRINAKIDKKEKESQNEYYFYKYKLQWVIEAIEKQCNIMHSNEEKD